MKKILIIGAGRSSSSLIKYLLEGASKEKYEVIVADLNGELAKRKVGGANFGIGIELNVLDRNQRRAKINEVDLVVSMVPANMHLEIVADCIDLGKDVITPSYITKEISALNKKAIEKNVLIVNELGLDPGIDHLSAMKIIDEIKAKGGILHSFESFTGGLVAPECDDNPWRYKFTWNPRNVVLAGQGGAAKFIQEGKFKYIPYNKIFRRTEIIEIEGYGKFEGYANRDSLTYRDIYGLQEIQTIYRGTLRRVGFCRAWDLFVQLGATDDSYIIENSEGMSYRDFINLYLAYNSHDSVELKLRHYLKIDQDDEVWEKLEWLGIFDNTKIGIKNATPAQVLQSILEKKWSLKQDDKDMIVMFHKFQYKINDELKELQSYMVSIGEDSTYTAMANTVGLPLGIAAKNILNGQVKLKGVHLPVLPEIYNPILDELETFGVAFKEKDVDPTIY